MTPAVKFQEGRYRSELHDRFSGPSLRACFRHDRVRGAIEAAHDPVRQLEGHGDRPSLTVAAVRGAGFATSGFVAKSAAWVPADYARASDSGSRRALLIYIFGSGNQPVAAVESRVAPRPIPQAA